MLNVPRLTVLGACWLFLALGLRAEFQLAPAEWAIQATFAGEPKADDHRTPTPQGDELAQRRIHEIGTDRMMIVRFVYPIVPSSGERGLLYKRSVETVMNSRSGIIKSDEPWDLLDYKGLRLVVEQPREKSHRELRFILIGASLYFISAEWAGGPTPSPAAARFLASIAPQAGFADARAVEERERWREIAQGNFRLRYDASRWFQDPQPGEPGTIFLLRSDELAEAEFTFSPDRAPTATMEEFVIAAARETAESVRVSKRAKRMRGAATVEVLRYSARVEGVNYENHGYFYSGAEGSVQVRAWAPEKDFKRVEGDIEELLDGLTVVRGK